MSEHHDRRQDAELERQRRSLEGERRSRRRGEELVEDLERQVRFLTLMNRSLLEVLVKQGATSLDAFAELMEALDEELDGQAGDGLEVEELAGELGLGLPELNKKERFLRSLKRKPRRRPRFD